MSSLLRPLPAVLIFSILYFCYASIAVNLGDYTSYQAEILWYLIISLMMAWWVHEDKKHNDFHAPFEFCAFVFFAWVIVLPYYLISTRGMKGLPWALGVVVYFLLPTIFWYVVERYWWGIY